MIRRPSKDAQFINFIKLFLLSFSVWISSSSADISNHIFECAHPYTTFVVGDDSSIFHAMNCALRFCDSELVQFLNAGDYYIKSLDLSTVCSPCLVPVSYVNYFGKFVKVPVRKSLSFGIPYCHQGMILPAKGLYFPGLRFGSDYLALLDLLIPWPLPLLSTGCVYYDNNGFSSKNRGLSDFYTARIIASRFGYFNSLLFLVFSRAKLLIKFFYSLFIR